MIKRRYRLQLREGDGFFFVVFLVGAIFFASFLIQQGKLPGAYPFPFNLLLELWGGVTIFGTLIFLLEYSGNFYVWLKRQVKYRKVRTFNAALALNETDFKEYVGEILTRYGFEMPHPWNPTTHKDGKSYVVRVKKEQGGLVGEAEVCNFYRSSIGTRDGADGGLFITTGDFTLEAYEWVKKDRGSLRLINGRQLKELISGDATAAYYLKLNTN